MARGYFITFEGGEGCGKSTQLKKLQEYLSDCIDQFLFLREPGGYPLCEDIRNLLLYADHNNMCEKTEFLLFSASRAELVNKVILPTLERGVTVICDRFYDSSIVYQGMARGLGEDNVRNLTKFAVGDLTPDATIYLDIRPEVGFARKGGADQTDRIEMAGLDFHNKVYEGYHKLAKEESGRFVVVDATKTPDEVFCSVLDGLKGKGIYLKNEQLNR